jgi:hypothetical protein
MLERRVNLEGRAATAEVPRITVGGLRMAALDLEATADFMIEATDPRHRIGRRSSPRPMAKCWRGARPSRRPSACSAPPI